MYHWATPSDHKQENRSTAWENEGTVAQHFFSNNTATENLYAKSIKAYLVYLSNNFADYKYF